jgi:outer membrane receptor protein involved in Fe transport
MTFKTLLKTTTALAIAGSVALPVTGALAQDQDEEAIEEVVVTGSYIRRKSQADSPNPIAIIGDEHMAAIGAGNFADVVQTLTINNGAQNNPDAFTQNGTTGTSNFNLRGLGVSSTLVLLNSRRAVTSGALTNGGLTFTDVSSLVPSIAVSYIEILKNGAAATYGSDAVAGVVNFITDDNFEGVEISADYRFITDEGSASDTLIEGKVGWGNDKLHVMAALSYYDRSPLTTAERRLSQPLDDASSLGNPGAFFASGLGALPGPPVPFIDPTGCEEFGGLPLALGGPIPIGPLSITPGLCRFDFGDFFNLVPEEKRTLAYATATYDFTDSVQFRIEGSYSDNETIRGNSPTFPFLQLGQAVVLASHPEYPLVFQLTGDPYVVFFGRAIGNGGAVSPNLTTSENYRISAELTGTTGSGIYWELAATHGQNDFVVATEDTVSCRFQAALFGLVGQADCAGDAGISVPGSAGTPAFYNPFSTAFTTAPNSQEVLDYIIDTQVIDTKSKTTILDGVVSGDLMDLPAGPLGVALGFQYRDETWGRSYDNISLADGFAFLIGNSDFSASRNPWAVFTEAAVPVADKVDLSLSLRYEDYGGAIGSSLDPKIAVIARPNPQIAIRGAFSTAFRAPSVFQQFGTNTSLQQVTEGGSSFFAAIRSLLDADGERDLLPETSDAWNIGFSWQPTPEFDINIDYWRYSFKNVIIAENSQAVVDQLGADPTRVIRSPSGSILMVMVNFVNASSVKTDGIDFSASYTADTEMGIFRPSIEASYVLNYDIVDPLAGNIEGAGARNFANFGAPTPEWRINAGFAWAMGGHSINAYLRYIDSMQNDQPNPQGITVVESMTTVDAQYNFNFGELIEGGQRATISVGVINAFDKAPPYVPTNGGFESRTHDPRGRLVYFKLTAGF